LFLFPIQHGKGFIFCFDFQQFKNIQLKNINELRKNYPNMTAEYLITTKPDHAFNLINRDQRTPIFEPEKWNENTLVVDAWAGSVYTKKEFILAI
jgi:hypothetical protein